MNKENAKFYNILKNAEDFRYVALRIIEMGEKRIGDKIYAVQYFTLAFFSIELYLKAILTFDNIKYDKIHELDLLFDKLTSVRKEDLEKKYEYIYEFMKKYRKDFEKWRYCFESSSLSGEPGRVKKVLSILSEYCNYLLKELDIK